MLFSASLSTNQPPETHPNKPASRPYQRAAAGSCRACPVGRYCAMYAPHQAQAPANCPFGPGPAKPTAN